LDPRDAVPQREPEPAADLPEGYRPLFNGTDLTGWHICDEADFTLHGEVHVKDGQLLLEEGRPMTGVAWAGEFPTGGYEVLVDAMRTSGGDFFCGMTFPVGGSWCTLIVGGWGGMVVGLSNVDGGSAAENETTLGMSFDTGRWYRIRVAVMADFIDAWIDDERVIHQARQGHEFDIWWEQEPARPFGINTWMTGAAFRNVALRCP
jgi:hypothetical protein